MPVESIGARAFSESTESTVTAPESRSLIPRQPPSGYRRLLLDDIDAPRLTHYLFRFPAKFHPRVVHSLIRDFTSPDQLILDPFCGSGTLMLAAAVEERHATGLDIDPLATFISQVKTHRFQPHHLRASWSRINDSIASLARSDDDYQNLQFSDVSPTDYDHAVIAETLLIPGIPNLFHWFRRYVVIDLARIIQRIDDVDIPETHRLFFRLTFASIIRKASNADPVPVSGLEVTSYMKTLDAKGRLINPFELFVKATRKALDAVEAYWSRSSGKSKIRVLQTDATSLRSKLRNPVDAVITSPPYHNAVDYYRRHQLEMFWLGLTKTSSDRLALLPKYIGRPRVRKRDPLLQRSSELGPLGTHWSQRMREISIDRADAFVHYAISIKDVLRQLAGVVRLGGPVVLVVGHSEWNGSKLPTSDLFIEMAGDSFQIEDKLWYPIKNRYMSYGRHNGANIDQEYVLVFRKTRP